MRIAFIWQSQNNFNNQGDTLVILLSHMFYYWNQKIIHQSGINKRIASVCLRGVESID